MAVLRKRILLANVIASNWVGPANSSNFIYKTMNLEVRPMIANSTVKTQDALMFRTRDGGAS